MRLLARSLIAVGVVPVVLGVLMDTRPSPAPSAAAMDASGAAFERLPDEPYGTEDLIVTRVYRISHPAYRVGAEWQADRTPYSRDMTRVLVNEDANFVHPTLQRKGRGFVWGYVRDLTAWQTLAEYEAAARPIVPQFNYVHTPGHSVFWSPFAGEESVLYAVYRPTRSVVRIDVDTQEQLDWVSYDPGDGTDVSVARARGWTTDNRLVVNFANESDAGGGFEIDVVGRTRTPYAAWPPPYTSEWRRYPYQSHGHGTRSPDGTMLASGFGSVDAGLYDTFTGGFTPDAEYRARRKPYPYYPNHASWLADPRWLIVSASCGDALGTPVYASQPTIVNLRLWQVYVTGGRFKYRELLVAHTAGIWQYTVDGNQTTVYNQAALLYPTVRRDGRQIYYTATEAQYTYRDHQLGGMSDWGNEGAFLADLAVMRPRTVYLPVLLGSP